MGYPSAVELSEERAARNEIAFRGANEEIDARRLELDVHGSTPYICECEDPACTELIRLTREEYRSVRSGPRRFLSAEGHPHTNSEIVDNGEGWVVIEKHGVGGEIAESEA